MTRSRSALVVGAGLAGSAVAAVLARHGWRVTLLAPAEDPGAASAVPAGVMTPPVGRPGDPLSRVRRRGIACTRAWLDRLERSGLDSGRVADGVIIRPAGERARARHARAGMQTPHVEPLPGTAGAVRHALGGCVRPATFAAGLRAAAGSRLETVARPVRALVTAGDGTWTAVGPDDAVLARAQRAVVAAGAASATLLPGIGHLLHPARGQATAFAATPETIARELPLSGGGYVTPAIDGVHWSGATLQRGECDTAPRATDDATNLDFARAVLGLAARPAAIDRFVGIRATTPNRIPLVGPGPGGAWISAGHGAHGLVTACLAAHLLADALAGHAHPWLRLTSPLQRRDRGGADIRPSP